MPRSSARLAPLSCAIGLLAGSAAADLNVSFIEGAPKDRFRIENTSACALSGSTVRLDLSTSKGALIFDVTAAGQGVEVFQPFELTEGAQALAERPQVSDGQSAIDLAIETLAPGQAIAFTIDVDDTIDQREITVTGSEIKGATVAISQGGQDRSAAFSDQAKARIVLADC